MFCSKCGSKILMEISLCQLRTATQQAAGAASGPSGSMQGAGGADGVVGRREHRKRGLGKADCAKALLYWRPAVAVILLRAFYKGKCMETHVRKIILWLPGIQKREDFLNKLYRGDSMKAAEVKPFSKDIVFTIDSIGTDAGIRGRLLKRIQPESQDGS